MAKDKNTDKMNESFYLLMIESGSESQSRHGGQFLKAESYLFNNLTSCCLMLFLFSLANCKGRRGELWLGTQF